MMVTCLGKELSEPGFVMQSQFIESLSNVIGMIFVSVAIDCSGFYNVKNKRPSL